jgi:prefoldin alpha subunit
MAEKKEISEKYIIYQLLQKNLEALQQQKSMVESQQFEIETTLQGLNDLEKVKDDNEILIPFGSGCYVYGKITNKNEVIVNLGANVMAKKDLNYAKLVVEEKKKELKNVEKELENEINKVTEALNELAIEIQIAAQESKDK